MNFVEYEEKEAIGIITINRESALNALNSQVLKEIIEILDEINLDKIRVLIFTGAGEKAFIAGADIGEMKGLNKKSGYEFGRLNSRVNRKIELLNIPTIAAINGFALGGGCELAMCCDIRIASENAIFAQPEVGLGITPGAGGTQRLVRLIPMGKAKEMLYSGNKINAEEALSLGLINAIYPQKNLLAEVIKLGEKIASNAPVAVRGVKKAIMLGFDLPMERANEIESIEFGNCFETKDQEEGMTAFLEKRKHKPYINK